MGDVLKRIKRLLLSGRYFFTDKATVERERDGLSEEDVVEAIINAQSIQKTINSQSPNRKEKREKLYINFELHFRWSFGLFKREDRARTGRLGQVLCVGFFKEIRL